MHSFHCSNELLALASIKYARTDTKNFWSNLAPLDFVTLHQNIFHRIVREKAVKNKTDIFKKHLTVY